MHRRLNQAEVGSLKIGSIVTRMLDGNIPCEVMVNRITPNLITVVTTDTQAQVSAKVKEMAKMLGIREPEIRGLPRWDFDPSTGEEIDTDIEKIQKELWGKTHSISFLATNE